MNKTFDGSDYNHKRDSGRLTSQYDAVFDLMSDGHWRTLGLIAEQTGRPEASISAQLRHARKPRFGAHKVEKQYLTGGLYQYRLLINKGV